MPVARDTQGRDQHGWRVISGGAAHKDNVVALMLEKSLYCTFMVYGRYDLFSFHVAVFQLLWDI